MKSFKHSIFFEIVQKLDARTVLRYTRKTNQYRARADTKPTITHFTTLCEEKKRWRCGVVKFYGRPLVDAGQGRKTLHPSHHT